MFYLTSPRPLSLLDIFRITRTNDIGATLNQRYLKYIITSAELKIKNFQGDAPKGTGGYF